MRPQNKNLKRTAGPGRPKGSKNKASAEIKAFLRSILDDPEYQANFRKRAIDGKLAPAVEAMMYHYDLGKPKEKIEVTGEEGGPLAVTSVASRIIDPKDGDEGGA